MASARWRGSGFSTARKATDDAAKSTGRSALAPRRVPVWLAWNPAASLAAEAGIAVFRIAFERWVNETSQPDLPRLIRESLDELKAVTAGK